MHTYSTLDYLEKCYLSVLEWVGLVSPAVSPSPQGQSQSQSPSGQSPSPSGVSPSPLDQSPSPLDPSPSLTKVRVSPDLVWTHESSSRKVHYFNPTFNNFNFLIIFAKWLHILIIILGQNWIDWYTEMCHFFLENWNNVCVHFPVAHPYRNGQI